MPQGTSKYAGLFQPGYIGNLWLKNRIVMSPMMTNFAANSGEVTEQMLAYYAERARGGAGLVIVEAAAVDPEQGHESSNQLRLDHPKLLSGLARLSETIKMYGAAAFIQLFHAGRQAMLDVDARPPVAPSPVACRIMKAIPRALSKAEILALVDRFAAAAVNAAVAGFDGVELHAAHGYLINQFLSPNTNLRTDEYGGSLENRQRFLRQIIEEIHNRQSGLRISVRLNMDDFVKGGFLLNESVPTCQMLEELGADVINVSCGIYESGLKSIEPSSYPENWRHFLSAAAKAAVEIPVIGGGFIRSPQAAATLLEKKEADFVFLGRSLIADPEWPLKVKHGREADIRPCITCNECISHNFRGLGIRCTVNPWIGREQLHVYAKSKTYGKVLVAGGGPAGMQAALNCAAAGDQVTIYEKSGQLGGLLNVAAKPPHKEAVRKLNEYLRRQVENSSVEVRLDTPLTLETIQAEQPNLLIVATGARPNTPPLRGLKTVDHCFLEDVLKGSVIPQARRVVIVGGGSAGCEVASYLLKYANKISIVEMNPYMAMDLEKKNRRVLLDALRTAGVDMYPSSRAERFTAEGVWVRRGADLKLVPGDYVVLALGYRPERHLYEQCLEALPEMKLELLGDARSVGNSLTAFAEAEMFNKY